MLCALTLTCTGRLFAVLGEVQEGQDGVQQVNGARDDAEAAECETDLFLLRHALVLALSLVAAPVVKGGAADCDEHECANEVHQHVLQSIGNVIICKVSGSEINILLRIAHR